MIFPFDKTDGFNFNHWNDVVDAVRNLPKSKWEIEIRKPKRTPRQNRTIHPLFVEVYEIFDETNFTITFGKAELTPTPELVKEFFKQLFLGGQKTSEVDTKTLSEAVDEFVKEINKYCIKVGSDRRLVVGEAERQLLGLK